ncbi:MAG: hypothetical protein ACW99F_13560 [Candidatus Hodarchaeales archaeon]
MIFEKINSWLKGKSQEVLLTTAGFLLFTSVLTLILMTGISRSSPLFIIIFFFPFILYLASIELARKFSIQMTKKNLMITVLVATLIQIIVLSTKISLSDDIYRFLFEGKMIIHGLNPYHTSLDSVNGLISSSNLMKINNSSITSPYPPLILIFFAFLNLLNSDVITFRISFSLAFILSIILLNYLLPKNMSWKLIIYAWNPLILLETGNGLHFEVIILVVIIFALIALENNHPTFAALGFLMAFFLKYYLIFPIVLFWKHFGLKGQILISLGLGSYILAVLFDPNMISGLLIFANDWYFNASIFWILDGLITNPIFSKLILGTVFITLLAFYSLKAFQEEELPYKYTSIILMALIILQPTFHPWYLLWLFPFILMDTERIRWSWILLSGLVILSYNVYILYDTVGIWKESNIIRLIEYLPFYGLFIYETRKTLKDTFSKIKVQLFRKKKVIIQFSFR